MFEVDKNRIHKWKLAQRSHLEASLGTGFLSQLLLDLSVEIACGKLFLRCGLCSEEALLVVPGERVTACLPLVSEIRCHHPVSLLALGDADILHALFQFELIIERGHVKLFGEVLLNELGRSCHAVKATSYVTSSGHLPVCRSYTCLHRHATHRAPCRRPSCR